MTEWLESAVAVREVSGSIPGWGGHKNLCGRRETSDYVSSRRAVERQRFHTFNTHVTKPRTKQQHSLQTPYTLELDLGPFPPDVARSFPPEWPIVPSVVCPRKRFPSTSYSWSLSMIWTRYQPLGRKWRLKHNKIQIMYLWVYIMMANIQCRQLQRH